VEHHRLSAPDLAEIQRRIRRVLVQALSLDIDERDLPVGTTLDEAVGLDSMASIEFLAGLEREFGMTFEPEQIELATLRDLTTLSTYISRRMQRRT
jgi:acyl carrier protein